MPSAFTAAAPRDDDDGDRPMKLQQVPPPIIGEPPLLSKTTKLGRRWCRNLEGPDAPPALDPKPNPAQPSPSSLLPPSSAEGSSSSELYPSYWHLLLPDEAVCKDGRRSSQERCELPTASVVLKF